MTPLSFLYKSFKENRIKKISNRMYEVDKHIVTIQTKKGRQLITCDCLNHTEFCNSPVFCWHKEIILVYPIFEYYDRKIEETINFLELNKVMEKNKLNEVGVIEILKDLRRIK